MPPKEDEAVEALKDQETSNHAKGKSKLASCDLSLDTSPGADRDSRERIAEKS